MKSKKNVISERPRASRSDCNSMVKIDTDYENTSAQKLLEEVFLATHSEVCGEYWEAGDYDTKKHVNVP